MWALSVPDKKTERIRKKMCTTNLRLPRFEVDRIAESVLQICVCPALAVVRVGSLGRYFSDNSKWLPTIVLESSSNFAAETLGHQ
jgi:hypothetical protein